MSKKHQNKWGTIALFVVVIAVAVLVGVGLWLLFRTKETLTTTESNITKTEAVVCEAETPSDPFFASSDAEDVEHQIKIVYVDDTATEVFYTYEADFGSPEAVEAAEAALHADYNIFMGKNTEDFSDQFMQMGDKLKVSIHADTKNLGSLTSRIFFITPEEYNNLTGYKVADLQKIFESHGFSCEHADI